MEGKRAVYSSPQHDLPLRELTCHTRSHSVTCHPAEVILPPLPQPKPVLDLATPRGRKAELVESLCYIPRWYTRTQTVTHPSTNRAGRALTSFVRRTPLITTPRREGKLLYAGRTERGAKNDLTEIFYD